MTVTEGRWSCPVCSATIVRATGQTPASWRADVWLTQQVHGTAHTQLTPEQIATTGAST